MTDDRALLFADAQRWCVMNAASRQSLRGIPFRFKYYGPRSQVMLLLLIMVGCLWLAAHPRSFDVGRSPGIGQFIDAVMQSLPDPLRVAACLATEVYLIYILLTYYMPCIRYASLIIFDGRELKGFRTWGRQGSLLVSEVERVTYRGSSAVVRGGMTWLWLPLSMMDLNETQRQAVRTMLDDASNGERR